MNRWHSRWLGICLAVGGLATCLETSLLAQCNGSPSFGYPASGCGSSGVGSVRQQWQQSHAESREQAEKVFLRNQAWPKPFDCWDRQSYFATWHQFYDAGNCAEMTLLDAHFDNQTEQLNTFGLKRLAAIVSNPSNERLAVFISRTNDERLNQLRVDQVRDAVGRMLGSNVGAMVAISDQDIVPLSGRYHSTVNELRTQQTPAPVINIGSQSSLAGSVSGN
ncbi:MAG TPA: hypothetical protein PKD54_07280 [Pirellulaceae bacterium]|nr:hypothetical protein [Pirellulaceae bacterium]